MSKFIAINIKSSIKASAHTINQLSIMGLKKTYAGVIGDLVPSVEGTLKKVGKHVVWTVLTDEKHRCIRSLLLKKNRFKSINHFSLNTPKKGLVVNRGYVDPVAFQQLYVKRMLYRR